MAPVDRAKAKVAQIFAALDAYVEARWVELVIGGYEASSSITGGVMTAHVGKGGEYAVYVGKHERPRMITIASGCFYDDEEKADSGQAMGYTTGRDVAAMDGEKVKEYEGDAPGSLIVPRHQA